MAEPCGCEVGYTGSRMTLRQVVVWCPMHEQAGDMLAALEGLLTVQPRPVKIPGTEMDLTVSYTEGDLLKMETARAVAAQARGGAHADLSGLADDECPQYRLEEEA